VCAIDVCFNTKKNNAEIRVGSSKQFVECFSALRLSSLRNTKGASHICLLLFNPPPPTRKLLGCWIDRITCGRVAALVRTPLHTQKMTKQGKDKLDGLGARVVGLIPAFAHFMIIIGGIMSSLEGGTATAALVAKQLGILKKKVLIENVAPFMWCVVTAARRNLNEKNEK
jgi:hypothetical protein